MNDCKLNHEDQNCSSFFVELHCLSVDPLPDYSLRTFSTSSGYDMRVAISTIPKYPPYLPKMKGITRHIKLGPYEIRGPMPTAMR